ncbi:vitamin K epoxide reductase family protein [uncultured Parabacteroides sp.]|uniref:vitamin K epoxide reductase family protein n=1 Tax=uncultured Parabacteroides sp. TaxID=512312 RepID=UPI00265D7E65|nr:vitamin K epoxide reductase family protein [uncultured Parabacteroides sp.]
MISQEKYLYKTIDLFLNILNVRHTNYFLKHFILQYPYANSLYGISALLSRYNMYNECFEVDNNDLISDLTCPFITCNENDLVLVLEFLDHGKIKIFTKGCFEIVSIESFCKKWNSICLTAQVSSNSIEPRYRSNRIKDLKFRIFVILSLLFLICASFYLIGKGVELFLLFVTNFLGLLASFYSILKEENLDNKIANKICSLFKENNCLLILNSKFAKLFGLFDWSKIGLSYFLLNIFLLFFGSDIVASMTSLSIPVTCYSMWSIGYQILKKVWCPFCLIVVLFLWLSFGIIIYFHTYINGINVGNYLFITGLYVFLYFCVDVGFEKYSDNTLISSYNLYLNKFKMNDDIFKTLLMKEKEYTDILNVTNIVQGDIKGKHCISILINPYCQSCIHMPSIIDMILQKYKEGVFIQFIYYPFNQQHAFVCKFFMYLYFDLKMKMSDILLKWLNEGIGNEKRFFLKYVFDLNQNKFNIELSRHMEWIQANKINHTPMVVLDGRALPEYYGLDNLLDLELDM